MKIPSEGSYAHIIRRAIKDSSRLPIENSGVEKAIDIVRELIESARRSVVIFCRELSSDVYATEQVALSIKLALMRRVKFQIIIQRDKPSNDSKELLNIFKRFKDSGSVEIYSVSKDSHFSDVDVNFCLVDNKMSRIETDRENRKGTFYAFNREITEKLQKKTAEILKSKDVVSVII